MTFALPRRVGKAQRTAAWLSSALFAPLSASAQQAPTAPAVIAAPAHVFSGAHNLLTRLTPQPMGTNNGVRLWILGDGSGATMRVHLLAAGETESPSEAALTAPAWLSPAIPVTWSGWREVLLPKEKFTLRDAGARTALNAALPADAQPAGLSAPAAPAWTDINAIALETLVPKRAILGVDDIEWVTLDESGSARSGVWVDDFEKGDVAAWESTGSDEQKKALLYGLATAPTQVHGGRVAFRLAVTAPAISRQVVLVSVKHQMAVTGKPYLVWTPPNRFDPIVPASLPPPGGATSDLQVQAAPDQTLGIGVCLYSVKPLSDVTVTLPEDLQGIGRTLSRTVMDVNMVKVMPEPGGGLLRDDSFSSLTPDLLVKDDREALSGAAPAARLTGNPVTDIPADTTKQFWVTITVPRTAIPGAYSGRLLVSGKGLAKPIPIHVALTVLPLRLASSAAKQYAINLRSRLDPAPAALPSEDGRLLVTDFVSKDVLDKQLADIRAHGFHIATLYDSTQTVWDALAEYQANGMLAPFVYKGSADPREVEAERQARSAPQFVYYVDPLAPDAAAETKSLGKRGLPVTTYITRLADFTALEPGLSVPVYSLDSDYSQQLLQTKGRRLSSNMDWWYWPAAQQDPVAARLACGWGVWRANLYGAFIPDYQTAFGTDPYDLTSQGAAPGKAALRSQMLTYPAQDGVIDTLRWEAAREGVVDARYLTTLFDNLRQCKDAKIAKPLTDKAESYVKSILDKSPAALSDAALDAARTQVGQYALQLRAQLDGYNKKARATQ